MAKDLADVIQQMASHGINLPAREDLGKAFAGYLRFRPEGARGSKKSAWVRLFEYRSASSGQVYITGAFGNRGDTFTVEATSTDWSPAERAAWLEHKKAAEKQAAIERQADAESAAKKAARMWSKGRDFDGPQAPHPYLERKKVGAFGVRAGFNQRLMIPLRNVRGELQGLQYISPEGDKLFGTGTAKDGHGHLIGDLRDGCAVLAFGEGYATCASAHMATAWPVVVCFDAGNLMPVMLEYRKLYPELTFAVLADDDRHLYARLIERLARHGIAATAEDLRQSMDRDWQIPDGPLVVLKAGWTADPNGVMRIEGTLAVNGEVRPLLLENAGQSKAHAAARKCKARVLTPYFVDRASSATDWNDLHCAAGIEAVREQLTTALDAPPEKPAASARAQRNGKGGDGRRGRGDGGDGRRGDDDDAMPFLERFTLIYGTTTVWDAEARMILRLEALKAAHGKRVDRWLDHSDRRLVLAENVVFDPTGKCQPPHYVNLFDRLPLDPVHARGKCVRIIKHIELICQDNDKLCHWVTSWLAYPLQHPGAKMRTALVLHGRTEGTGKSTLGEIMRRIYGRFATSVGQAELQRDFNDWISAKLLILAEEVVSRQDRAHHQGMLQALITQPKVQINTKNMPIREEANHANFLFFSNAQVPLLLNPRDRRYTVIRVEQEQPPEYFEALAAELNDGGAEAFYDYLLKYDLDGFNEYTKPFESRDRMHLITLGMTPDVRFFEFWRSGLAGVPFCTCPAADLYAAFKAWCRVNGERFVSHQTAFGRTISEELERVNAPPKKVVRYEGYSDKQIADSDLQSTTQKQGIVYFVPARLEVMRPRVEGDEDARPPLPDPPPDVTDRVYINAKVKLFQAQLAELLASARRSM